MANPKPGLDVIYLPCRTCGGKREHFGSGVCWDCMGPVERERLAHDVSVRFKYAGHSGPHPSLVVGCPTCGAPVMHYCVDEDGDAVDRPCEARRRDADA